MNTTIHVSPETYNLLQKRAREMQATPDSLAETAIRLQFGNTFHIEQRNTPFGAQAYVRGTRVAVRHVAAFLQAGHSAEEIAKTCLPHISPAAIYEAIAYYYEHQTEIDEELAANSEEAVRNQLRQLLTPTDYARLTGKG
jgi:uncharacterized protein (DUF433 family)